MGKFIEVGTRNPNAITSQSIRHLDAEGLQSIVSDIGDAAQSTLSRAEERAAFLRDVGEILVRDYGGNPLLLYGMGNFLEYANVRSVTICPLNKVCKKGIDYWHPIVDTHFH